MVEYTEHIIGKMAGKIFGLIYVFFLLHVNGMVVREYSEFVAGNFLHRTPSIVITGTMLLVCAYAVHGGIEVIARSAQIIVPVFTLLFFVICFLLIPDLDIKNMFPILENGIMPSFIGSIVPQSWMSEYILIAFLLPYTTDQEKGLKWGLISVGSVTIILIITNLAALLLLGRLTATSLYPVMVAVRYISIADFLEHLESVVMSIWVAGTFIKISVFYYALVLGTAQLLKLSDYRLLVLPFGMLIALFGMWSAPNLAELTHFLSTSNAIYMLSIQTGFPALLLGIALFKKRKKGK